MIQHWTQRSTKDFAYSISLGFTAQLELKMQERGVSRSELAGLLHKSTGRVSQILNDPGNIGTELMVECAHALGMKVAIVAYDDHDPENTKGPIHPEVFTKSWEKLDRPVDLFEVEEAVSQFDIGKMQFTYFTNLPQHDRYNTQVAAGGQVYAFLNLPNYGQPQSPQAVPTGFHYECIAQPEINTAKVYLATHCKAEDAA